MSGTVVLRNNTAYKGGAVFLFNYNTTVDGEVEFTGNSARESGGGMFAFQAPVTAINKGLMTFIDNQAEYYGAAISGFTDIIVFYLQASYTI